MASRDAAGAKTSGSGVEPAGNGLHSAKWALLTAYYVFLPFSCLTDAVG